MKLTQAADKVFLAQTEHVNWVLIEEAGAVTVVDAGFPAQLSAIEDSVLKIGRRPEDIAAMLITHAHVDHIGCASALAKKYSFPIYSSATEVPHARRDYQNQASPLQVVGNLWRPGVLSWSVQIMREGALQKVSVPEIQPFTTPDGPLDVPGRPVPVPLPGHTRGHCGFLLKDAGVAIVGDALITGHGTSRVKGPQFIMPMFHYDEERAYETAERIADLPADVMLTGHGPEYRGSLRAAVDTARTQLRGKAIV